MTKKQTDLLDGWKNDFDSVNIFTFPVHVKHTTGRTREGMAYEGRYIDLTSYIDSLLKAQATRTREEDIDAIEKIDTSLYYGGYKAALNEAVKKLKSL